MTTHKCVLLFAFACCIALATALPLEYDLYEVLEQEQGFDAPILVRRVRSPQHGSVSVDYNQDRFGKRGSVEYNHNLLTSRDGRGKIDAYAQGSRDFSHNRNDYGGGIRGSWRF